ncbi:acyl-CoA dehydrogenase family protein [Streptomyces halobius]|uniref:Acyl-CoA/acyl-ACP dehydrogenase n=1 Tax=Streptomyces halobius TaxID=2879846 RepID=A0ABY4MBS7_9ACTN|nr:acyl-CoA dehydrogenase family protein [Streptomyces halobius]UQA94772.1 acyl-CoA/acyl-ACP dehydrogenase [Streptomyces halobius]
MDAAFTEEQHEIRRTLRELLHKRCGPDDVKAAVRTPPGHDEALWRQLAQQLGLPGLALPAAYGGVGCGPTELALACEEAGRALLPSPLIASAALAAPLILALGSERQRAELLPAIAAGKLTGTLAVPGGQLATALALTGPNDGDWAGGGRSGGIQARPHDGRWRLYGEAGQVLDGHTAGVLLVAAHTGGFARSRTLLFVVRGEEGRDGRLCTHVGVGGGPRDGGGGVRGRSGGSTMPDARPNAKPDTRPSMKPDTRPSMKPDTRPDTEPDTGPDTEPDTGPDMEPDTPGLLRTRQTVMDETRPQARIELRNVPAELLGYADGAGTGSGDVDRGEGAVAAALAAIGVTAAAALAAEAVGAADAALARTVEYVRVREQFGRPIGSFQAVQHRLADLYVAVQAARSAAYYAAWSAGGGGAGPRRGAEPGVAALALAQALETQRAVAAEAVQLHGGIGFTWEHEAHLYFKRAACDELLLGPVHRLRARAAEEAGLFDVGTREAAGA